MAWFYTVLLAVCSLGILAYALVLTRRLFRDELPVPPSAGSAPTAGTGR